MAKNTLAVNEAVGEIITNVSSKTSDLMVFGFEMRKADEESKYSDVIFKKATT